MTDKEELSRGDALAKVAVLEAENAELRKLVVVPEGWTHDKPVVPGAYWVRGNGLEEAALVVVKPLDNELWCNLHVRTTEPDFYYGYTVAQLDGSFEWLGPLAAAPAPVDQSATTEKSSTVGKLWAVHAQGPDELYPAFNREDAERHAAALNALSEGCSVNVSAVVVESPWPPAEHWKYLAEQEREHAEQFVDIDAIFPKSAPVERNQCDGCQAGIPVENGMHRMGKPGAYADLMACTAYRYGSAPVERVERAKVFWVLFDNTGGEKFIKKCADTGSLAFFDSEADAARAKRINPGTDYKRVEYYTTPQPAAPAPDVAGLEREAETERQIQRACGELPEGWTIQLELENGAGYAVLYNPEGVTVDYGDDFDGVAAQIEAATDCALAARQRKEV